MSLEKSALVALCALLSGCAETPKEYVPVAIATERFPIVSECNPRLRSHFPKISKVPGNKTPLSSLEDTLIEAGKADLKNEIRETQCYCSELDERGTQDEKANSKTLCSTVKPKPKAKSSALKLSMRAGVGS